MGVKRVIVIGVGILITGIGWVLFSRDDKNKDDLPVVNTGLVDNAPKKTIDTTKVIPADTTKHEIPKSKVKPKAKNMDVNEVLKTKKVEDIVDDSLYDFNRDYFSHEQKQEFHDIMNEKIYNNITSHDDMKNVTDKLFKMLSINMIDMTDINPFKNYNFSNKEAKAGMLESVATVGYNKFQTKAEFDTIKHVIDNVNKNDLPSTKIDSLTALNEINSIEPDVQK